MPSSSRHDSVRLRISAAAQIVAAVHAMPAAVGRIQRPADASGTASPVAASSAAHDARGRYSVQKAYARSRPEPARR